MNKLTFVLSILSVIFHYYDYHIIAHLALQISQNFMPNLDPVTSMLSTYVLIYISILAKPLGAIIFGKISDVSGRQSVIKISLLVSAIASLSIACIPSYSTIGIFAVILLLLCRIAIATVVSSGTDSVRLYLYERFQNRKYLGIGISSAFSVMGTLVASYSALLFTSDILPPYAWRFSIALGGIVSMLIYATYYFLAHKIDNVNYIKKDEKYNESKKLSILQVISQNKKTFILIVISTGCFGGLYNFNCMFWGAYNKDIINSIADIKSFVPNAIALYSISALFFSYLSDIFKPYIIFRINIIATIILYILLGFSLFDRSAHIWLYLMSAFFLGGSISPALGVVASSATASIRQRMFSMGHAFGSMTISNTMPIIVTSLYKVTLLPFVGIIYGIVMLLAMFFAITLLNKQNVNN